jgi:hypothetical protein
MTATYIALANTTVTGTPSTVTFGSIPNTTYTDLVLVMETVTSTAATKIIRFNSDSGANYNWIRISGNGTSGSAASNTNGTQILPSAVATDTSTERLFTKVDIIGYRRSGETRSGLINNGRAGAGVDVTGFRWRNTTAISTITISLSTGTFTAGSTLALYGIVS